jgi:hypothetical protein
MIALNRAGGVTRQQRIEQSRPAVECCRLETLERCCEINQAAAGRKIEHAQRAGNGKATAAGDADTFTIVHKHQRGLDGEARALSLHARPRRASPR